MASSSKPSIFLASHGKKYDPTFGWNDDDGLLQDPRTHAPYYHVDTKVSFSLVSLLGKNVVACFIESFMVKYFHLVILKFWGIVGLIRFGNVGFGAFLKYCFFFDHGAIWAILVAYGILTM